MVKIAPVRPAGLGHHLLSVPDGSEFHVEAGASHGSLVDPSHSEVLVEADLVGQGKLVVPSQRVTFRLFPRRHVFVPGLRLPMGVGVVFTRPQEAGTSLGGVPDKRTAGPPVSKSFV